MDNKEKNFVSAIIYVHNAEKRIGRFLKMIIEVMEHNFEHSEIICVNDHSSDGSLDMIKQVSNDAKHTSLSVLTMSHFHGLEVAMLAGIDLSIGDFVFEFDSTFADYDTAEIMKVYHKSLEGYDIVSASGEKALKLTSRLFYYVFDNNTDISYKMGTESFRILSRRVINRISSMNKAVLFRKAAYYNCGLKTINLKHAVHPIDMEGSIDKAESKYRLNLAVDTLILYTKVGYKFSILMTAIMMAIAIAMVAYSVIVYLKLNPVPGWTTTILFTSFAFFGFFAVLTIIIKYLQLMVDLLFKNKWYNFESLEKLTK